MAKVNDKELIRIVNNAFKALKELRTVTTQDTVKDIDSIAEYLIMMDYINSVVQNLNSEDSESILAQNADSLSKCDSIEIYLNNPYSHIFNNALSLFVDSIPQNAGIVSKSIGHNIESAE